MKPVLFVVLMIVVGVGEAQTCAGVPTTPTSRFQDVSGGAVIDRKTGLMWMRCALGQRYEHGTCTWPFDRHSFVGAGLVTAEVNRRAYAGHRDWRLPAITELASIVEHGCFDPAINLEVFPGSPITGYWSASEEPGYARGARLIHFYTGGDYLANREGEWAVRLVRDAH